MTVRIQTLIVVSSLLAAIPVAAQDLTSGFTTPAPRAFLKDISTNTILYAKDADAKMPPASMGKMMTVLVAFDLIRSGEARLDQKITVRPETWRKWHSQGSTMFLSANEQVTVDDLLNGIVTLSGNDACVVLAEGLAGSEVAFVELMNDKARKLGLRGSRFANTNGWPDPDEFVTARDLATIAEATIKGHPDFYRRYYGRPSFTWGKTLGDGKAITQPNRNPLLGRVTGADGLKTGHTEEAGYGFTGSAVQGDRRLVMVVAGLDSMSQRTSSAVDFISWGFTGFSKMPVLKAGASAGNAPVEGGAEAQVSLVAPRDLFVVVPKGAAGNQTRRMVLDKPVVAPVAKGQKLGSLIIGVPGRGETRLPLVAGVAVEEAGPVLRGWNWLKGLFGS